MTDLFLFSSLLLLVSCGEKPEKKIATQPSTEMKTEQVKPQKEVSTEKISGTILNQKLENMYGNIFTIIDWTVIPSNTGSNDGDRSILILYYTIDKDVSDNINSPSEFYSTFNFKQGKNKMIISDYSSFNFIRDSFPTGNYSQTDNYGLATAYNK